MKLAKLIAKLIYPVVIEIDNIRTENLINSGDNFYSQAMKLSQEALFKIRQVEANIEENSLKTG